MLKQGVLRSIPHNPSGALPLACIMVLAIVKRWGNSRTWWKVMVASLIIIMFMSLLRGAGALSIPVDGVAWIFGLVESSVPPADQRGLSGCLLLVPSRKSKQTAPSWIPLRAGYATQVLSRFCSWRQRHVLDNTFLFPSRKQNKARGSTRWFPHTQNNLSSDSFLLLLRRALMEVCGLSAQQALRFTLHSLRVGGINYYKRLGVSIGMRAQIASHKSLQTSRRYLRLLPHERLSELARMVDP